MQEVLISLHPQWWEKIKNREKTIEVRKTMPRINQMPFRVIVYATGGIGVVGKFDCDSMIKTIKPERFLNGSCLTSKELYEYAAGKPLCGWHVKEGSVVEYEEPIPLEKATGFKYPPQSWRYLNSEEE